MLCYSLFYSFFFFKQKAAYEMRISDWSSDVCSSDLPDDRIAGACRERIGVVGIVNAIRHAASIREGGGRRSVGDDDPLLFLAELIECQSRRTVGRLDDHVGTIGVHPLPRRRGRAIDLVLVVGVENGDGDRKST